MNFYYMPLSFIIVIEFSCKKWRNWFLVVVSLEMRKQRKMGHVTIVGPSKSVVKSRLSSMLQKDATVEKRTGKWYISITWSFHYSCLLRKHCIAESNLYLCQLRLPYSFYNCFSQRASKLFVYLQVSNYDVQFKKNLL